MRKKTLLWLSCFVILISLNLLITFKYIDKVNRVNASTRILDEIANAGYATNQAGSPNASASAELGGERVANLKQFFRNHNSPLYEYAELIVETSDKYQFDYRLLPAIAMQESTLCQNIPKNSHNCWGWGIYGNTVTRFASYDEAVETVAKGIREEYINKGYTTTTKIMEKYTPSSDGSWAKAVGNFMKGLE
jgi:hypothetical protein